MYSRCAPVPYCYTPGSDNLTILMVDLYHIPFEFTASESGAKLQTGSAVFEQIPPDRVYNVIARSQS